MQGFFSFSVLSPLLLLAVLACAVATTDALAGPVETFRYEGGSTPDGKACSVSYEIRSSYTQGFGDEGPVRNEEICGFEINAEAYPDDTQQRVYRKIMRRCEYIGRVPLSLGGFTTAWFGENSPYISLHLDRGLFSTAVTVEEDPARFASEKAGPTIECKGLRLVREEQGEATSLLGGLLQRVFGRKKEEQALPPAPSLVQTRAPAKVEQNTDPAAYQRFEHVVEEMDKARQAKEEKAL